MVRQSPNDSATLYSIGTKKKGNDGKMWVITKTANGVKRWKHVVLKSKKSSRKASKKGYKKASKKSSKKSSRKFSRKASKKSSRKNNSMIDVKYHALKKKFPDYKNLFNSLSKIGWKYTGKQEAYYDPRFFAKPRYNTDSFFIGQEETSNQAKKIVKKIYDKYKDNGYLSRYVIKLSKN